MDMGVELIRYMNTWIIQMYVVGAEVPIGVQDVTCHLVVFMSMVLDHSVSTVRAATMDVAVRWHQMENTFTRRGNAKYSSD